MKKSNGMGSIYKVNGRRRKKWRVVVTLGYDENGKQIRKNLGYYSTKVEGQQALSEYHADKGKFDIMPTLGELFDILQVRKKDLSKHTHLNMQSAWNRIKIFNLRPINQLKTLEMQELINNMVEVEEVGHGATKNVKTTLSQIFDIALENAYVNVNFARLLKLPKSNPSDKRVFSDDEIKILMKDAEVNLWSRAMIIQIFTCLRPSELLQVKKDQVFLEKGYLIAGMKTEAGKDRTIPITNYVKKYIEQAMQDEGKYLISLNGSGIGYDWYRQHFHETSERLGLQKLTPHLCRKTGATFYKKKGLDKTLLQRLLGHSDYRTTDEYYISDMRDELINAMKDI